ncbi:MAG: hypothetical protein ACXWXD_07900 [Candidatus Deferrimicrobiaceae bacterium]
MTMHYVSLGKSHIREQVEKLNAIRLLPSSSCVVFSDALLLNDDSDGWMWSGSQKLETSNHKPNKKIERVVIL